MDQTFSSGQLMAAILDLRKTTEDGFAMMYALIDGRLDGVDSHLDCDFDIFERRVHALE